VADVIDFMRALANRMGQTGKQLTIHDDVLLRAEADGGVIDAEVQTRDGDKLVRFLLSASEARAWALTLAMLAHRAESQAKGE
jgi:hypothetical protein